jgi:crotonobetainyl-CoA:carnitine CoA-transferase CaiB-like acyl-CoA transferase
MILGDLGADVIKVERPGVGDDTRGWGPPFDASGRSAYYLSINRNKLGIAADLDSEEDRRLIERLLREADVVVDNFRPGTLERRGVSPEQWCADRPDLIWCTVTGFGLSSDRPGYDFVAQAECGWMAITGEPSGDPMKAGVALADILAGKDAAIAVLGALVRKQRTGKGGRFSVSLADSARAGARERGSKCARQRPRCRTLGKRASQSRSIRDVPRRRSRHRDRRWQRCALGRVL